jgi:Secretion system C-terminal sorting domain
MKNYFLYKYIFLSTFLLFYSIASAQSGFVNAGGDFSNTFCNVSYSIGQLFTNEIMNESGELCEGVQYVNRSKVAAIKEIESSDFIFYPNPTNGKITLKNSSFSIESNYYISVTDMIGKKLQSLKMNQTETTINLNELGANGIYLISIHNQEGYLITSKRVLLTD